jgi:hypothetical protein
MRRPGGSSVRLTNVARERGRVVKCTIMADVKTENQIVTILYGIIKALSMSVGEMEQVIPKPVFLDSDPARKRWRFEEGSPEILQVLLCVRIASALRACVVLLANGHMMEMGVLFRTIDDFLADITFADEIIEQGIENATTVQKEWLEGYFIDDDRTTAELLADSVDPAKSNHNMKRRQKVQASEARVFGGDDPYHVKKLVKTIDDRWNGTVHGSYFSVMTMYGGPSIEEARFETEGMPTRFSEYRHFLGLLVHNALNQFFKVSINLGIPDLADHLRELRREFEKSPAYIVE